MRIPSPIFLITAVSPRKQEGASPTGLVGRHLARQLIDSGVTVRVLAEDDQLADWRVGVDVHRGSITRPEETGPALSGVSRLFMAGAEPASVEANMRSAAAAGVDRIVVLSSHGSEYEPAYPPETWFWLAIERVVEGSGLDWTHIRPSAVMGAGIEGSYPATGSDWAPAIRRGEAVREPYLSQGCYPFIHEADLAAVAAAALLRDDYIGQILEAVAPPISTRSRIEAIEKAIGRPIATEDLGLDAARAIWQGHGWPNEAIAVTFFALEAYASRFDELTEWTRIQRPAVEEMIGRGLISFEQWALEHRAIFEPE